MLIENPDVFKTWLTSILEPLCDADPAALAKYVYALVKKDKPLEELRDGMLDQLDVFLQHETKPFVELLFRTLETQEYLAASASERPPSPPRLQEHIHENHEQTEPTSNGVSTAADQPARGSPPPPVVPRHRVVLTRAPPVKLAAPAPRPPYTDQTLVKVMPLTELLEEPLDQPPRRRERRAESLKEKEERLRRRRSRSRSWERGRRVRRHPHPPAWRNVSPPHQPRYDKRRASRSPSPVPRGRYRNRSPPAAGAPLSARGSRSRSRSPLPVALAVRDRERERGRSREREHDRDRMSRDREHRDRLSRERERERDRSRERSRGSAGTPTQDSNPGDAPAAPGTVSFSHIFHKRRCRDFDEKGYCMRGDLCQWDHGADPVVLEDAALSRVLTMAPPVPERKKCMRHFSILSRLRPPKRQSPLSARSSSSFRNAEPSEYNPLAPDIWSGGAPPMPGFPPYPPPHHMGQPPRELIPIPSRVGGPPPPPPVMQPHRPHLSHPPKKNFDYNRLGGPRPGGPNCSLEVKKVPRGMNDITHLNNHFGKFGRIVNIQVCFEGDPEAALITFSSHTEANVAYKSTEAVLNNRFIKVFWHNPESKQENVPPSGTNPSGNMKSAPERPPPHVNPPSHAGSHNKVLINKDNMKATADNKVAIANAAEKAKESGSKAGEAKPTPVVANAGNKQKQVQDMRRRAYTLLQTQLRQQKLLIDKLENGNVTGPQRDALMEAIKSAQEGIEKLQKELLTYPKIAQPQGGVVVKKLRSREEAQKEILDMELDLFTKQQEGQDVSELLKKVAELRRQQSTLAAFPHHSAHVAARRTVSRGAARFTGGNSRYSLRNGTAGGAASAPQHFNNQSVDHRPRALLVSGFEADEVDAVVQHFAQYGEIVSQEVNASVPELVLQYKARAHAEQACVRAKHYNDRTLSITWTTSSKPASTAAATPVPAPAPPNPAETTSNGEPGPPGASPPRITDKEPEVVVDMSEETLLQDDEDDDEDEERSWRR